MPTNVLVVADLSAIETRVIGWLAGCERLLNVFRNGLDPYIDFAQDMFGCKYEEVTSQQRQDAKPAVLGCGFGLGGGALKDGKRTGLWGYAETMGVNLTQEIASAMVDKYRKGYSEVVQFWYDLERASCDTVRSGYSTRVGRLKFELRRPYLVMILPSGRPLYYHLPRVELLSFEGRNGPYEKDCLSYMGRNQITTQWERVYTHGGKVCENAVQATARDIFKYGMLASHRRGFNIVAHNYDEQVTEQRPNDPRFDLEELIKCLTVDLDWADGLPLAAAGYTKKYYRK